jgi:signal transduction histidine kinase
VRAGHSFDNLETVRRHQNGRDIPVSLTVSPILDPAGAIIGASVVARDMTERLMQEEQLRRIQKMEAVGQLTSGVAHDFNNLLTVVLGNTRLMRKRIAAEKSQATVFADITERIEDIETAAQRGADLVKRLMVFTRQRPLQKTVVGMNTCIKETKSLLARVMGEKIEIRVSPGLDVGSVLIDQDQFVNALINMAANARDAMPEGGSFTIATAAISLDKRLSAQYQTLAPGQYVIITISDTGTGMPDHVRQRIFDPFYTTKPAGQGTGLGLSMVYGMIQQSGGHIEVESVPGRGTTFRIYLPAYSSGAPA